MEPAAALRVRARFLRHRREADRSIWPQRKIHASERLRCRRRLQQPDQYPAHSGAVQMGRPVDRETQRFDIGEGYHDGVVDGVPRDEPAKVVDRHIVHTAALCETAVCRACGT